MFLFRRSFLQRLTFRELIVLLALVAMSFLAHETGHKFHGENLDVMRIGPAPAGLLYGAGVPDAGEGAVVPPPKGVDDYLGVRYDHLGYMDIDIARWGGHLIVYEEQGTSLQYRDLEPAEITKFDLSVPWRVYLPEGLIALLCLVELSLVARKPRTVRFALIAGGVAGAVALVFRIMGLTWESAMPGVIALHHLSVGIMPLLQRDEPEAEHAPTDESADEPPARPSAPPRRETAPRIGDDPFRSPPQAPPIVVQRATTEPAAVPVEHDANAAKPKLLT
ncbi:MAG TPA: hypothetical protein VGM90_11350 [Kofleriaceae bacterium]|jgi:hypothetical protein